MILATLQLHQTDFSFSSKTPSIYEVKISDKPVPKENSILCHVTIEGKYQNKEIEAYHDKKHFLLYFAKDEMSHILKRGDILTIYTHLSLPQNNGNPDEFDYRRYLIRNGISGMGYVASSHWRMLRHDSNLSFSQVAQDYRDKLIRVFQRLGFQGDNFAVLSALTVGYMNDLSNELKEVYSIAGVSHVLSLSGLHIGILYALLLFLFSPFWKRLPMIKPWIYAIIVMMLWGFAFFTGAQPPVIRSVIMATVYALSCLQSDKPLSLNTLSATAFFMLLYNPLWVYDVGFQLSFVSIAAILLLQPPIYRLLTVRRKSVTSFSTYIKHKIFRKGDSTIKYDWLTSALYVVWGVVTVSIAAQLGTAPLIAHYFHQLPTHFLITNLWIIPVTTLVLYLACFMLLMTPFPSFQQQIADVLNNLLDLQNEMLHATASWPLASIDQLWLDGLEVVMIYFMLLMIYRCLKRCTFRRVSLMLFCILLFFTYQLYDRLSNIPSRTIVFYNDSRKNLNVHCFDEGGESWLFCVGSHKPYYSLYKSVSPYWTHLHIPAPHFLPSDASLNHISAHNDIVDYGGKCICLLCDDRWLDRKCGSKLNVDYLFLSSGYKGRLIDLANLFNIRKVILNSSFSEYRRELIEQECKKMQIPYIDLSINGALFISL